MLDPEDTVRQADGRAIPPKEDLMLVSFSLSSINPAVSKSSLMAMLLYSAVHSLADSSFS